MNYTTVEETQEQEEWPVLIEAMSVYRAFEQVQDGRHKRGVRVSLALILTLIVLAKLAGMTTLLAIADWVRRLSGRAEPGAAQSASKLSLRDDLQ